MDYREVFLFSIVCAMAGFTWINHLVDPDGIFSELPAGVQSVFASMKVNAWWRDKIEHVLFVCEKCMAGQIAFWSYIIVHPENSLTMVHIFTTLLAVFFAGLIHDLWVKFLR